MTQTIRDRVRGKRLAIVAGLALAALTGSAIAATAAAGGPAEICGQYETMPVGGGYEVGVNLWNSHGNLCVRTDGGTAFHISQTNVSASNKNNPGDLVPGGYPFIGTPTGGSGLPIAVTDLGEASTSWAINAPDSGRYNASYDIWFHPDRGGCGGVITDGRSTEVMIWLKSPNLDPPDGWSLGKNVTIGGNPYNVYTFIGPTGQQALIYELTTPATRVDNLKLQPIAQDAVTRGKLSGSGVLCKVQAGFEVHDNIPTGLGTTSFDFNAHGAAAAPTGTATDPSAQPSPAGPAAQTPLWADEFNGTTGSAPDTKIWKARTGDWTGNNTLQYYSDDPENAHIVKDGEDSYLAITAQQNTDPKYQCSQRPGGAGPGACAYTSAELNTASAPATLLTYGRVEARIKLPGGQGAWPSLWMLGAEGTWPDNWPGNGEIDIFESIGAQGCIVCSALHGPNATNPGDKQNHWKDDGGDNKNVGGLSLAQVSSEFHTYAVDKYPDRISFSIDGKTTRTIRKDQVPAGSWVFDKPMYTVLTVAVGGTMAGDPPPSTTWPQTMLVDYVRAYANDATPGTGAPSPSASPSPSADGTCKDASSCLFHDDFEGPDGVISSENAHFDHQEQGPWEVTSGTFSRRGGVGWSDSPIFRANTARKDFGDVSVSVRLRNLGIKPGTDATNGLHIWLRHIDQTKLYVASVNRRDDRIVIKKKLPGGPDPANGGTYCELGGVPYKIPYDTWQTFTASITTIDGGVKIDVAQGGKTLLTVEDKGTGGPPILDPGAVGLRADNTTFEADDLTVAKAGSSALQPSASASATTAPSATTKPSVSGTVEITAPAPSASAHPTSTQPSAGPSTAPPASSPPATVSSSPPTPSASPSGQIPTLPVPTVTVSSSSPAPSSSPVPSGSPAPPSSCRTVTPQPCPGPVKPDKSLLFGTSFAGRNGIITNSYAYRHPKARDAVTSPDWTVTGGSLVRRNGVAWSGIPDDLDPNATSSRGTGSSTFRMTTKKRTFKDASVDLWLRNLGSLKGAAPSDGVHLTLRQQGPDQLYDIAINRRDNRISIKKRLPGRKITNRAGYVDLGSTRYTPLIGNWQNFTVTIRNVGKTVIIEVCQDGRPLIRVTDQATAGRALTKAGAIGISADNTEFELDGVAVRPVTSEASS